MADILRCLSELPAALPPLNRWARDVADAMGFPSAQPVAPSNPRSIVGSEAPVLLVGFGVHTSLDTAALDLATRVGPASPVSRTAG
ncbi:MAG: hypothetical protein ACR2JF_18150 [Iamia sp.]